MTEIEILKAKLQEAENNARKAFEARSREVHEIYKAWLNTDVWEWSVTPVKTRYFEKDLTLVDTVRVIRRIRSDAVEAFAREQLKDTHPSPIGDLARWHGMDYSLTDDGIIHGFGGGYLVLVTPKVCSQEEWDEIKQGVIPEKFKRQVTYF